MLVEFFICELLWIKVSAKWFNVNVITAVFLSYFYLASNYNTLISSFHQKKKIQEPLPSTLSSTAGRTTGQMRETKHLPLRKQDVPVQRSSLWKPRPLNIKLFFQNTIWANRKFKSNPNLFLPFDQPLICVFLIIQKQICFQCKQAFLEILCEMKGFFFWSEKMFFDLNINIWPWSFSCLKISLKSNLKLTF